MKRSKSFISREVAGEIVLVPADETAGDFNGMITLTETGAFIWEHIEETRDFTHLVDLILDEYEIDRETAAADASTFLMQLLQNGMVHPDNSSW